MLSQGLTTSLSAAAVEELSRRAHVARGTVLTATTLAASGHPGGSFSSMEMYTVLYSCARLRPAEPRWADRDRIVVSHGHTSPGVYSAMAEAGFFAAEEVAAHFRQAGSVFEGHVERSVPGIEWSTGNLGQGLSAGVGFALGARVTGAEWHTFVAMSDAEQHKGQVAEARRLAAKYQLANITAVIDWNHVQISGHTEQVMPVPVAADWAADGWRVLECDGHDVAALHAAIAEAVADGVPSVVLAHTVIGSGVSFMEDQPEFHGRGLTVPEYVRAMRELDLDAGQLDRAREQRTKPCLVRALDHQAPVVAVNDGESRVYAPEANTDNRSAWGTALVDIAEANPAVAIMAMDCDLAQSVKTEAFWKAFPERFIECGVGEHNTATAAGALSTVPGVVAFWSDFGVFGIDEVYNQQRLNDINGAALKLVVTHCGLDVGEDGKTHQCVDYIGAMRDLFGWTLLVPADPNQTDRAVRTAVGIAGNVCIAVGRSKLPVILAADGRPLFGAEYRLSPGELVWARQGGDVAVIATGTLAGTAVKAADVLAAEGVGVAAGIAATPLRIDDASMREAATRPLIVTVEDHSVRSGLGATVAEWLACAGGGTRLVRLGVEEYQSSGSATDLFERAGLDVPGVARRIRGAIESG